MTHQAIKQENQDQGMNPPRITLADIEANIASEHYFTASDGYIRSIEVIGQEVGFIPLPLSLLTFCVLILKNGFTVTGENACASPENFDTEIARKTARQNAVFKVHRYASCALVKRLAIKTPEQRRATNASSILNEMTSDQFGY